MPKNLDFTRKTGVTGVLLSMYTVSNTLNAEKPCKIKVFGVTGL